MDTGSVISCALEAMAKVSGMRGISWVALQAESSAWQQKIHLRNTAQHFKSSVFTLRKYGTDSELVYFPDFQIPYDSALPCSGPPINENMKPALKKKDTSA